MTKLSLEGIEIDVPRFSGETDVQRYVRSFADGVATVPRGQSARLIALADTNAKRVPDSCMINYRTPDSRQGRASLRKLAVQSSRLPFVLEGPPLESIDQPLAMSITAGDARIAGLRLDLIDAPQINELKLGVKYPPYLRQRATSLWLDETVDYRTGLRLPQGTEVTLLGIGNMPLKQVDAHVVSQLDNSISSPGTILAEQRIPARPSTVNVAAANGNRFELGIGRIDSPMLMEFRAWEESGHSAIRVQQFVLGVLTDEIPSVDMKLDGIGNAITEQAILPVLAKVSDDHDIQSSWTEMVLNEDPVLKLPAQIGPDGAISQSIDLRVLRDSGC